MKNIRIVGAVGSMLTVLLIAQPVLASSIIGTNISTTGTLTVEDQMLFASASGSASFELTAATSKLGINAGGTTDTMFEVGGTASISGTLFANGALTVVGQLNAGALTLTGQFIAVNASLSASIELTAATATLGINAGGRTNTAFEVGGSASVSGSVFAATSVVAGSSTASSSSTYVAEFTSSSTTASTSVLFGGGSSSLGTCIQMRRTDGAWVYGRVLTSAPTVLTFSAVKCHQ